MTQPVGNGEDGFRLNPILVALLGGVAILLAVLWYFSANRSPDQDKLSNPQVDQPGKTEASKRCSARATYDLVKRELFSRAAQQRGSDEQTYQQIAAAALLRVDNAVLENEDPSSGALNCSGTFYLDLPPGIVASGGRRSLMANMDYAIEPAGNVLLRNADAVIAALVTLTRVSEPTVAEPDGNAVTADDSTAAPESANVVPGPATSSPGRPSFDCARAATRGEVAVCSDSGLAALDVNMTAQYRRALTTASPEQLRQLQTTRNRFLAYRDGCPDRTCMANAYLGRMREIRDIMEGRWRPR